MDSDRENYERIADSLVSVIIPTYNCAPHIASTLSSVTGQTHPNLEIIVVDDCSTDATVEVVTQYASIDSRVKLILSPSNSGGPATPRNIGLDAAKGNFIAFLDADDLWAPKKIEMQLDTMHRYKLDFVCSKIYVFDTHEPTEKVLNKLEKETTDSGCIATKWVPLSYKSLLLKNKVALSSVLLCRNNHLVRFSRLTSHIAVEDYHLWLTLAQTEQLKMALMSATLVGYRESSESLSSSKIYMAKRIYSLLGEFDLSHIPFGMGRFYYFLSYAVKSILRAHNTR